MVGSAVVVVVREVSIVVACVSDDAVDVSVVNCLVVSVVVSSVVSLVVSSVVSVVVSSVVSSERFVLMMVETRGEVGGSVEGPFSVVVPLTALV